VTVKLEAICKQYNTLKQEDIWLTDPCMGSGHILVLAFDVLMQIYNTLDTVLFGRFWYNFFCFRNGVISDYISIYYPGG
jgi:hypothetical protein